MTTPRQNPIDRALERVRHSTDPTNIQTMYEDWIVEMRAILTDLAAEIEEKHDCAAYLSASLVANDISLRSRIKSLEDRLAAVAKWREKWYDPCSHTCDFDELDAILALARGEGGSDG